LLPFLGARINWKKVGELSGGRLGGFEVQDVQDGSPACFRCFENSSERHANGDIFWFDAAEAMDDAAIA
jgi:hypothetical protein